MSVNTSPCFCKFWVVLRWGYSGGTSYRSLPMPLASASSAAAAVVLTYMHVGPFLCPWAWRGAIQIQSASSHCGELTANADISVRHRFLNPGPIFGLKFRSINWTGSVFRCYQVWVYTAIHLAFICKQIKQISSKVIYFDKMMIFISYTS